MSPILYRMLAGISRYGTGNGYELLTLEQRVNYKSRIRVGHQVRGILLEQGPFGCIGRKLSDRVLVDKDTNWRPKFLVASIARPGLYIAISTLTPRSKSISLNEGPGSG